ncbi:Elongation factor 1-delta [Plecturocebus cupreus]
MATNFPVVHLKIWFDMFKYDDAERRFYEQINWPVAGASRQEKGASVILRDIARARETIQKSLTGSPGPRASSGPAQTLATSSSGSPVWKWRTGACAAWCRSCSRPSASWRPG